MKSRKKAAPKVWRPDDVSIKVFKPGASEPKTVALKDYLATRPAWRRRVAVALLMSAASAVGFAQTGRQASPATPPTPTSSCSPSPAQFAAQLRRLRAANTAADGLIGAMDKWFGVPTTYAEDRLSVPVVTRDDLFAYLVFPYPLFRLRLQEALRKREPVEAVQVDGVVSLIVAPQQMDAPDIVKVIVERDGKIVQPVRNLLVPKTFENRLRAKTVLHAGAVVYNCSTFAPGAKVTVTLIPASGTNTEYTLRGDELLMLYPQRIQLAFSLIGKTRAQVEELLGTPSAVDGLRLTYKAVGLDLSVYLDQDGIVTEASPDTLDLALLRKP